MLWHLGEKEGKRILLGFNFSVGTRNSELKDEVLSCIDDSKFVEFHLIH